mgnify:CR=1 FL=1
MSSVEIDLKGIEYAFAQGGNRLCFRHPNEASKLIKILLPERSPAKKRSDKKGLKRFKPLSRFDDNLQEWRTYRLIDNYIGEAAYQCIPNCYGWVETNLGKGLVSELILDSDDKVAVTLKQFIWQHGVTQQLESVLAEFEKNWACLGMPSRHLLLHNIVVQCGATGPNKLVVIDGLGWPDMLPLAYWFKGLAKRKSEKRCAGLRIKIKELEEKKSTGDGYGYHGWLDEKLR